MNQAIQEKYQAIQEKERQLGRVNQQLEENERLIADFGKRNTELEEQLIVLRSQVQKKDGGAKAGAVDMANIKLRWREGKKAPHEMSRYADAVVDNNTVYCQFDVNKVYAYHIPSSNWSPVPDCPTKRFAITVIDDLLTTVGGFGDDGKNTNKLFSLTGEGSGRRWTERFLPMPTKRYSVSALCTGTVLIVAGGNGHGDKDEALNTVEVLNTETGQWHTAPDLPEQMSSASITLSGDFVYLLGGLKNIIITTNSVYSCQFNSLLLSAGSKSLGERLVSTLTRSSKGSIWNKVADLSVRNSTAVTLHGRLLAIGGWNSIEGKPSRAVHMYQPITDSWEVISHMATPRYRCLAAVLSDNQLMVVGGWITKDKKSDSVECGRVI